MLYEEDTEAVVKEFIKTELGIPDAEQINFQNVHRLRKSNDGNLNPAILLPALCTTKTTNV